MHTYIYIYTVYIQMVAFSPYRIVLPFVAFVDLASFSSFRSYQAFLRPFLRPFRHQTCSSYFALDLDFASAFVVPAASFVESLLAYQAYSAYQACLAYPACLACQAS
uniref:Putative uncharacterized protein VPS69 n=1 Tax=Saccharomyces cerevisiae (strain ATCC 204508 / S288c) TaxID=559292 RepID=VPS69_YEAST|nr:RecName: Full=Putative uncharacterized protein VPS69 [Saccharomyces cerevisiae S288C]AAB68145.1 Ypr087wp [Saccharomyces cerevisiae]